MSFRVKNVPVICVEPPAKCEECGAVEELRPYGKNGARICFDCGMKDEELTKRNMGRVLFGDES